MRFSSIRSISAREALPRIAADVAFLGVAALLGFFTYSLGSIVLWGVHPFPGEAQEAVLRVYLKNFPALALLGVVIFASSGFYTHARSYRGRFRLLVIFNSVSLVFLLFSFLIYFLLHQPIVSRGIVVLTWFFSLVLIGGARMLKGYVESNYSIQRKVRKGERRVENVLVIGGAGYIGSILVRQLLEAGFGVSVLDELFFGDAPIASLRDNPRFKLIREDFRHVESVVKAVRGTDAVVHLGAIVGDPACQLDAETSLETNLAATAMIKDVCRGAGIQRFLFASTCSVYGASPHLLDERSAPDPISLYACTKLDSERVILSRPGADFAPTVLRLGTAFGWSYRPRFDLVVNLITARAFFEQRITIYNQTQWRPFIHVTDIARGFVTCLQAPTSLVAYEIFNVGSNPLNHTLGDLALRVKAQVPSVEAQYVDNDDKRNYRVAFDKVSTVLGFSCTRTLEDGIREMKHAFESGLVTNYRDTVYYNDRTLQELNGRMAAEEEVATVSEQFLRKRAAPAFAG
jgi:nucleoside-diphosphate-sugar epimerase